MDFSWKVNYISAYYCIVLSCFGFFGNLAIAFAFQKEKKKTTTTLILQALALSDFTVLLTYIPFYYLLFNEGDSRSFYIVTGKRNIFHAAATFTSVWITVLVAINR